MAMNFTHGLGEFPEIIRVHYVIK